MSPKSISPEILSSPKFVSVRSLWIVPSRKKEIFGVTLVANRSRTSRTSFLFSSPSMEETQDSRESRFSIHHLSDLMSDTGLLKSWKALLKFPINLPTMKRFSKLIFLSRLLAVWPGRKDIRRAIHHSSSAVWRVFLFAAHLAFELTGIRTSDFVSTPSAKGNNSGQGKPLSLKKYIAAFSAWTRSPCLLSSEFKIFKTYSPCSRWLG